MTSATRSETARIRPFAHIDAADLSLEDVRFVVGGVEYEAGAVVLPDESLGSARLALRLPVPQEVKEKVARTVVPAVDCGLVVMASSRSHRICHVFVREYFKANAWPAELELERDVADLVLNDRAGFTLTVAVVLLHDLSPEPLRPHMAGTWLARREFVVSPQREDTSFSPEELTDEIRTFRKLPQGVLRFVDVGEWREAEALSDEVHVYVDPEVLNLLLANPNELTSVQMQIELALQATETVAVVIARDLASHGSAPSANALDGYDAAKRFFENLARNLKITLADALDYASNDPATLRAYLEVAFNMRVATSAALKEK